ncbi:response regulator [Lacihabitans soyangensis]|nr:response regulator [Lacihabitans soyangensis]
MKKLKEFLKVLVLCSILFEVYAQEVTLDSTVKFPLNISTSIETFQDASGSVSLEEVLKKSFSKPNKDHFVFPYSDNIYWVRVSLKNNTFHVKEFYLLWSNPLVEQLDFYISDRADMKDFKHVEQKIITKERDKKFIDQDPRFIFKIEPNQTRYIYFKLTSKRGHYGELRLHTRESFQKFRMDDFASQGFLNGLMFFRLFLVLVLSFFIIKDLSFRLYSLYTLLRTFNYWGYLNIAGPLFTDQPDMAKKIDFLCYNSATLGAGIFLIATFTVQKLPKVHLYLVGLFLLFTVFFSSVIFFDYQWYWLKGGVYTLVFSAGYYILLYIFLTVKNVAFARYYSILFTFGLLSSFLLNVRLLGWIELKPIYTLSYYFFLAEFVFFVIFLGRIFRNTERNKTLTERQLKFNIEQNNKLKELDNLKTTFFTNISHEIRTPLTLITGPFQQLAEKYPSDKLIPLIQRNTDRLLTLVNQILDISKLEAGQMKPEIANHNITEYLRTLTSSFISLAESRKIDFERSFSSTETYGFIDRDKVDKIVTNLLSNAFKFTPQGGKVSFEKYFDASKKRMTIVISDTGIGIESEKLSKIYDRFYQADDAQNRSFEGTGIGLALVKELVEVLKGKITVESQKDEGTTFSVELPIDRLTWKDFIGPINENSYQNTVSKQQVQTPTENFDSENDQILLIVDDNEDIRNYVRSIFEIDYKIVEARNGKDGVEKAIEQVPDIIISDLMMPEMDGLEFCKVLKADARTSHIPIVMLTAKANVESRIEGYELGADDYVIKPFNKNELQARVKNLLDVRAKLRQKYESKEQQESAEPDAKVNEVDGRFIQKVIEIIDEHLSDSQFGIDQLADEMLLSTTQLRRKIKVLTNQTIVEFIRNHRLHKAAQLLSQNTGTISEIAYQVGFDSLSYFSKVFQESYGVSPSDYRVSNLK